MSDLCDPTDSEPYRCLGQVYFNFMAHIKDEAVRTWAVMLKYDTFPISKYYTEIKIRRRIIFRQMCSVYHMPYKLRLSEEKNCLKA